MLNQPPFFANGQTPGLVASLVGVIGAAVFFSSAAITPVQPKAQATGYGVSTRNLAQPAPQFSKIAPTAFQRIGLSRQIITSPQAPLNPQPNFSRRPPPTSVSIRRGFFQPASFSVQTGAAFFSKPFTFAPASATVPFSYKTVAVQTPEIVQPVLKGQVPPSATSPRPNQVCGNALQAAESLAPVFFKPGLDTFYESPKLAFRTNLPQDIDQPAVWFAEYFRANLESPQVGFRFSNAQSPELLQPWVHGQTPPSIAPPAPVSTLYGVSTRNLDQPAPSFSKFPPASITPPVPALRPLSVAIPPQNPEQPAPDIQRVFFPEPKLPGTDFYGIGNQTAASGQGWFSKAILPSTAPQTLLGTSFHFAPGQPWEILQPHIWGQTPPSTAASAFKPVSPSLSVGPRPENTAQPFFSRMAPAEALLPAAALNANWQQPQQFQQPSFLRTILPSAAASPFVPTIPSLAVQPRQGNPLQPTFSRAILPSAAPSPFIPVPASISWAVRNLTQPSPQFFKTSNYPPPPALTIVPSSAQVSWQIRNLDQPSPWFQRQSPAPSFLPPNIFGSIPLQGIEQRSPNFSRQTPPSIAPTSPPLRATWVSAPLQSVEQRSPIFSHQPPPTFVPPPVIFQDGSIGDSIRKKKIEDVRLPKGKSARQEIKDLWNPVLVPPVQLALFDIPDLTLPPNSDDDIIPALLLLGML